MGFAVLETGRSAYGLCCFRDWAKRIWALPNVAMPLWGEEGCGRGGGGGGAGTKQLLSLQAPRLHWTKASAYRVWDSVTRSSHPGVDAWSNGQHVCFPSLPPMLECGFESRLGLEFSVLVSGIFLTFSQRHTGIMLFLRCQCRTNQLVLVQLTCS